MDFNLLDNTILVTVAGSRAYGMALPSSDIDIKGVCIQPKELVLGFAKQFYQTDVPKHLEPFIQYMKESEQRIIKDSKLEGTIFALPKFMKLACNANPNILDVLFCRDQEIRYMMKEGEILRNNRELFLSKKAKHTFCGYAFAQLKRIKGHRSWLLNPPNHEPTRKEFGLPECTLIPSEQISIIESIVKRKLDEWSFDFGELDSATVIDIQEQLERYMKELSIGSNDELWKTAARMAHIPEYTIQTLSKERSYKTAHQQWEQYNAWKVNRNETRAELEKKFGYDTKHGAHLIRLLRMGKEILSTGKVNVFRDDAEELLSIRAGAWEYEKLIEWAEREEKELDELYKTSILPHAPSMNKLNELCIQLMESWWNKK